MKILLTGASSYVGAGLYVDLKKKYEVTGTYNSNPLFPELKKLDIINKKEVFSLIKKIKPEVIIHAAANPSSKWCEQNPDLAIELNKNGTEYIVEAANLINAKVIYISSFAAMNPILVYNKTKKEGEDAVKKANAGFIVLRPSLIIGYSPNTTNDRPFNRILKDLKAGKPVTYDSSWKFQPTWLKHISEVIDVLLEKKIINETITISVPEIKTRYDLAKDILSAFNIKVEPEDKRDLSPVFQDDLIKLTELNLPRYSYSTIIEKIINEIKDNIEM